MDTASFLKTVVTTKEGFFNLAVKEPSDQQWTQEWFTWPDDLDKIVERSLELAPNQNVYFSSHLFEIRKADKQNVLPSRTIQADLDDAILPQTNAPSILVETSPNRHQGFWIIREALDPTELEALSRQVTYSIPNSDHSGWSLGHKMRVPGTYNHKYTGVPKPVRVINALLSDYARVKLGPNARKLIDSLKDEDEDWTPQPQEIGPRELWLNVKPSLHRRIQVQYDIKQADRSLALFALECALFRAGLNRDQVFLIARESLNNKFKENRYHADEDLAKHILSAEHAVSRNDDNDDDIRSRVMEARKLPGHASEKRAYITALVRDNMSQHGSFVSTTDGQAWFVREDTGRPVLLASRSDYLNSYLEIKYGLNATEPEQRYVIQSLMSSAHEKGRSGITAALSHYDKSQNVVLLHTGRKDVLHIDPRGISKLANGNLNIVFPWRNNEEPFDADLDDPLTLDTLFQGCFDNLNEMAPEEALALIKAWVYFLFFRNDATGRPILALFGQPGSGKSTLFRRIYTLLYGTGKAVNSVTTGEDFDQAVANDPLVVFDNVDTWVNWLPDKLALSASTSDLVKRKLYSDSDTVTLKRQALVGLTAHNPKFRREDIVDRLLILSLHRLPRFKPETELLQEISYQRDRLWGGIVQDLQKILAIDQPHESELPRFRVSDYARIGLWIARALDFEDAFRSGLARNVKEQTSFNLEEEDILVETIKLWVMSPNCKEDKNYSVGELWTQWSTYSRDPQNFVKAYRNAVSLGKKLWSLQETLKTVVNVDFDFDPTGSKTWRFSKI